MIGLAISNIVLLIIIVLLVKRCSYVWGLYTKEATKTRSKDVEIASLSLRRDALEINLQGYKNQEAQKKAAAKLRKEKAAQKKKDQPLKVKIIKKNRFEDL